jgi:hypothetical protein
MIITDRDDENDDRELHCGDVFQIEVGSEWRDVRIEHSGQNGWYLLGLRSGDLTGAMHYVGQRVRTYA